MIKPVTSSSLPALRTGRIYLREHRASDLAAMQLVWGDPTVMRYMESGVLSDGQIRATLAEATADAGAQPRTRFRLAACLSGDDTAVGTVRLEVREAALGYVGGLAFSPQAPGVGWVAETAWLMLKLAFAHLGLARCCAFVLNENTVAQRAFGLFGATFTGERDWRPPGRDYIVRGTTMEMTAATWRAMPADPTPRAIIRHRRAQAAGARGPEASGRSATARGSGVGCGSAAAQRSATARGQGVAMRTESEMLST
jgi:RimJ/RimL family protein N-acetyltransferase